MFTVNFANDYLSEQYELALLSEKKEQSFFHIFLNKVSKNRKQTWLL